MWLVDCRARTTSAALRATGREPAQRSAPSPRPVQADRPPPRSAPGPHARAARPRTRPRRRQAAAAEPTPVGRELIVARGGPHRSGSVSASSRASPAPAPAAPTSHLESDSAGAPTRARGQAARIAAQLGEQLVVEYGQMAHLSEDLSRQVRGADHLLEDRRSESLPEAAAPMTAASDIPRRRAREAASTAAAVHPPVAASSCAHRHRHGQPETAPAQLERLLGPQRQVPRRQQQRRRPAEPRGARRDRRASTTSRTASALCRDTLISSAASRSALWASSTTIAQVSPPRRRAWHRLRRWGRPRAPPSGRRHRSNRRG